MKQLLFVVLLALSAGALHAAELYKWRDAEGVHYSDQPPPPGVRDVERRSARTSVVESDVQPYETRQAAKKYPVTLYAFKECGEPCSDAQAYLTERGIPFTLKDAEEDQFALVQLTGDNQAPVLVVGNQAPLKGFQKGRWKELLDLAGYPQSNPLAKLKKVPAASAPKPAAVKE